MYDDGQLITRRQYNNKSWNTLLSIFKAFNYMGAHNWAALVGIILTQTLIVKKCLSAFK